jgi:DNA modification methylase
MTPYYQRDGITLYHGDCLACMPLLATNSLDAIVCDPPYGTTSCKWDSVIPLEEMWNQIGRVSKPSAATVLHASQPFTTTLINSNREKFKYAIVWDRVVSPTGHLNAKTQPLRRVEDIAVFYALPPTYNPQMGTGKPVSHTGGKDRPRGVYGANKVVGCDEETSRYPVNIVCFKKVQTRSGRLHPTQKPVELMEYLIRTYTNEGDTVLEFAMGSGTTLVACVKTGRRGIGIEIDEKFCEVSANRVDTELSMSPETQRDLFVKGEI